MTAAGARPEIEEIGVGLLGPAGVGRAHAHAYRLLPLVFWPPPARPRLVRVCGRDRARAETTAARFGFEAAGGPWEELVAGPRPRRPAPRHLRAHPPPPGSRPGRPPRRPARLLREAARPHGRRGARAARRGGASRRGRDGGLQLPLRPGGAARPAVDRRGP